MTRRVLEHIARHCKKVKEGVKSIMGGQILEYEAKTIWKEGKREGRKEGQSDLVKSLLSLGTVAVEDIQRATGWTKEKIESLRTIQ